MKFAFETTVKVTEPFLFTGFTMKDVSEDKGNKVRIKIDDSTRERVIKNGSDWQDQWLDVSHYMGKTVTITIEADGRGDGTVVLGDFGLSPGYEKESALYERLMILHKKELDFLEYKESYEGIHLYENRNVMDRAFVLHEAKALNGLNIIIRELQNGINFREVGIVTEVPSHMREKVPASLAGEDKVEMDIVMIKKYASDEVAMEVESRGGLLVLSDLYYPGWKVKVNGREEEVIEVFGLLRGVIIKGGKNDVLFYYRPISLYVGILISVTTYILWILFLYFRGRKEHF